MTACGVAVWVTTDGSISTAPGATVGACGVAVWVTSPGEIDCVLTDGVYVIVIVTDDARISPSLPSGALRDANTAIASPVTPLNRAPSQSVSLADVLGLESVSSTATVASPIPESLETKLYPDGDTDAN